MAVSLRGRFWRFILRATMKNQQVSIEQSRSNSASNARFMGTLPKDVALEMLELEGIRAAWIKPTDAEQGKAILHLHGGGYVTGSIEFYEMMCIQMAQTLKMNLLLPEYRLAPEQPFPAALEDALKMYRWLRSQGYKPADILISGDSAGGGLCLATVLALREAGEALPAAIVCFSPWVDLLCKGKSHLSKAKSEVLLRTETLKEWGLLYTAEINLSNPLVSPVYGDFHGFPPLFIQVGSEEILLDDAVQLAEKARGDGVNVTLKVWDGMWHVWQALGKLIPESGLAFEELAEFVRAHKPDGVTGKQIT